MIKQKQGVFGSAILLGGMVLAGCGTSGHPVASAPRHYSHTVSPSSVTSPSTTPSSRPVSASPSPTPSPSALSASSSATSSSVPSRSSSTSSNAENAIQTALQSLAPHTHLPLYAPTTYPGEAHTPLPITVSTQTGTTPTAFYQLLFDRGGQHIGSFTVRQWPSARVAPTHILPVPINLPSPSLSGTSINLGSGMVGTQTQWKDSQGQSITAITWQEGRWHLIVEAPVSQTAKAVTVGHRISAYLHTMYLPVPSTQGWIIENFQAQKVTSQVSWNHNALTFLTSSVGPWNSNLSGGYLSALNMAAHIQEY